MCGCRHEGPDVPIHAATRNHCLRKASVELGLIGSATGTLSGPIERKNCSHWGEEAPELSLPELLRRRHVKRVDFLKIDIEGSEFALFSGGCEWLRIVRKVVLEVHWRFGDVNGLHSRLENNGFQVWLVDNHQAVVDKLTEPSGYLFARKPN